MRVGRPVVLLTTLAALAAPVAAAVILSSPVHAVSPAPSVAAELVHAPEVVAPAAKPVAKAVAKPAAKPVVKPVVKPAVRVAPRPARRATTVRTAPVVRRATAPQQSAPVRTTSDDYPYRTATDNSADAWGFTKRQCVSFAAFRLAQHGHRLDNATQNWGSALHWDETARQRGVTVTGTPRVGAIAHWNAGESSSVSGGRFTAGGYGHVGYVAAVYADGTALVEQYNLGGNRSYSVMRMTAPRYLVF